MKLARLLAPLALVWLAVAPAPAFAETIQGRCVSVHDGDTLTVVTPAGRREKVRLLGIDAPEIKQEPWGVRSRDFTRGLVLDKDVRIETDVQPRDKYGRLLGYVWLGETFVNREIVRSGHAMLLTYPPNVAHVETFTAAQAEARRQGLGVWDPKAPLPETPYQFRHKGDAPPAATRPAASLAPDTQVRFNPRSKKIHPPGCGHECQTCRPMRLDEAERAGGRLCKAK